MHAPRRPAQSSSLCRVAPQPFFAYVAPHAPHTRASPAPGSDGYFHDWQVCFSCHGRPRPPPWLMQLLSHFLFFCLWSPFPAFFTHVPPLTWPQAPRTPSWNISAPDHHWLVREQAPLTEQCIYSSDHLYQNRLR